MQGIKLTALHLSALEIGAYNPIARELAVIMRSQDERIRYYSVFLGGCLLLGEQQGWLYSRMIPMRFLQQRSGIGLSFVEPWVCPCCRQPLAAELLGDQRMAAGYPEHLEKQSCRIPRALLTYSKTFFCLEPASSLFCFDIKTIYRFQVAYFKQRQDAVVSQFVGADPIVFQVSLASMWCQNLVKLSEALTPAWVIISSSIYLMHLLSPWQGLRGIFLEIYLTKESQQLCARSVRFQFSTQGLPSAASGGSTKVSPFLVDIGALGDDYIFDAMFGQPIRGISH